uniref:Uncharacterized protein n=1 Tax=Tetranychus urticae TaxID=32264 RepID=T1KCU5_TETUR
MDTILYTKDTFNLQVTFTQKVKVIHSVKSLTLLI